MPVEEIRDGTRVQGNHVYVIPPNHNLAIQHEVLSLLPRSETRGSHLAIDSFFQSLAQDRKNRSIGIILSGTGSDGTQGLEAIKAEGGLAIAQDPITAKYDGMPHSAIAAGVVDLVLTPKKIAEELIRFARHPLLAHSEKPGETLRKLSVKVKGDSLTRIFALLRNQSHVDFTHYKLTTIKRRIDRRMVLHKKDTLEDYASFLQANPQEVRALFADILINVTEFFRDPDVFTALKKQVLAKLVKSKAADEPIRVWVVGCATGEEAYSVAIALLEVLGEAAHKTTIQIFATDISELAIQKARAGTYPASIQQNISQERLTRFFEKTDTGYKISKSIRDMCLFSRHDVTRDPPFSKLDLICCRNLLIYFDSALQKHVLSSLHYALNAGGFLWLGRSESVGNLSTLFRLTDKFNKFYLRGTSPTPPRVQFGLSSYMPETLAPMIAKPLRSTLKMTDFQRESEQLLLSEYAPPGVVVNNNMEIILTRGNTAPYLQLPPGQVSTNLFKMASHELAPYLRMAVQAARKNNTRVRSQQRFFNITVIPFKTEPHNKEQHFWILFEPITETLPAEPHELRGKRKLGNRPTWKTLEQSERRITELTQELTQTRAYQQSLIEDHEATQDEITASNEELQSTNEELQSTNEELETAKEELQSTNEELTTVNDELQNRNTDLSRLNNDLINLLGTVDFPIIMVGADGNIRRFTPTAGKLLNLLPNDVGRPIGDIRPGFDKPDLRALVSEVIETITIREYEVSDREGHWFRLQVRPYKTTDNRIDGAVISLVDITLLKHSLTETQSALEYATSVADTLPLPLVVLDEKLRLLSVNKGFSRVFEIVPHKIIGSDLITVLGGKGWKIPKLRDLLLKVITEDEELKNYEIEYNFPEMGHRIFLLNAQQVSWQKMLPRALLLSIDDVTERRKLERALASSLAEAERANRTKDDFLATLSHELRTPLTSILSWSQMLSTGKLDAEKIKRGNEIVERSAKAQCQLIDDLLDISRIQAGKLNLTIQKIDPAKVIAAAIDSVRNLATSKSIQIETSIDPSIKQIFADPTRLQQILWNLITNSIKFTPQDGRIWINLDTTSTPAGRFIRFQVRDNGKGIKPEFIPSLFERFTQFDSTSTRAYGGLGLGLAIVQKLVEMHEGTVKAESPGEGKGSTFTVFLPTTLTANVSSPKPEAEAEEEEEAETTLNGLRILVVDDEANTREAFATILQSFGADVKTVESASRALAVLEEFKPDVLVSDIAMPIEDGYTLIRKVRALKSKFSQTPSLALTAYAGREDMQRAHLAGFQSHLAKPVDANKLALAIGKLAGRK